MRMGQLKGHVVVALSLLLVCPPFLFAADQKIDLDGNPINGQESMVETNLLQTFPVRVENVVHNNTWGIPFSFDWPGAGPGGFDSILTVGPDVGTKWEWTTLSQVYSIQTPAIFTPNLREVGTFGAPGGGVQTIGGVSNGPREFSVPGKSIFPTQVTVSSATLTSSLVTFFSPERTIATCGSTFVPGRFEQTITNNTGETVVFSVEEPDCCPEPNMTICEDGCQAYLTDPLNCGGCGITCAADEFCDLGSCAAVCPLPNEELCDGECVDVLSDPNNCGGCGNVCDATQACNAGVCEDQCDVGEEPAFCDGECVDLWDDPNNCGECGNVCGEGQTCSRLRCIGGPDRGPRRDGITRGGSGAMRAIDLARVPATEQYASSLGVVEAPVCDVAPIVQEIADGETVTICQSGTLVGKEVFTTATIDAGGETLGQGPCALVVPDNDAVVRPFEPSPVSVQVLDQSGDRLLQPGESAELLIEVLNLGPESLAGSVATLSSAPDNFNPLEVGIPVAVSDYPDFPALTQPADCNQIPVFDPKINLLRYEIEIPADHEPDVGRVFNLNFQGDGSSGPIVADMPLVLGIGSACVIGPGFNGETYDGLAGLLEPVNADLVPPGDPVNYPTRSFQIGEDVPLVLKLKCGEQTLSAQEIAITPEVFKIEHPVLGEIPLTGINATPGSNSNDPFFTCDVAGCEFLLDTTNLPAGRVVVTLRLPDSRTFEVGLIIRP